MAKAVPDATSAIPETFTPQNPQQAVVDAHTAINNHIKMIRTRFSLMAWPALYTIGVWSVIVRRAVVRVAALLLTSVITFTV